MSRSGRYGAMIGALLVAGVGATACSTPTAPDGSADVAAGSEQPCRDASAAIAALYTAVGRWQADHLGEPMHRAEVPDAMATAESALRTAAGTAAGTAIEAAFRLATDAWDQYGGADGGGRPVDDPERVAGYLGLVKAQDELLQGCRELGIDVPAPQHSAVS